MTSTLAIASINRNLYADAKVTLNGQHARITGLKRDFATIVNIKSGESHEWSWNAVERIVAKGGAFEA